ncbi:hypothetical protein BOTCAL_0240g00200 [Botryotinia calthae]|uniref:Uncharacterized protein n=1 Tax=Botryotinia calthae TaxID=38488 RepID=A0A4Y8CZF1_9HELO|nr:hypothetical protein BOTCAL_0240g00200 [Botryotinia calthae]
MPPSFLLRKTIKTHIRLDRVLLPSPPPPSHLAHLATGSSLTNPINRMRVWWWKKTPMQRTSAVVDIPLLLGVGLLVSVEVRDMWRLLRRSKMEKGRERGRDEEMEMMKKELNEEELNEVE